MGGGVSCLKLFLQTLAVVGFICFLLIGTLETRGGTSTAASKHADAVGREKLVHPDLDLNYMVSKRRVPKGPDPIHNRRAGSSGRPPGQA
ncbi:CLAVATA3/ESR (CLE)-related protein 25 [Pyrus ussuriensis x Pyrus communis]|uniref:CLAVATA3/ESR (CLE)-related protein 25 n=1 Tax=Pyrus ussuriensis x Pyrus communis TaxID=2448454 RepID=A0A5N5HAN0_9ROSA|nr:CLAVATA3/ESR (CLE)-related protein 25 [Pyrus ussuriensis x Pyrus communis]